jgi:hypothetical protein
VESLPSKKNDPQKKTRRKRKKEQGLKSKRGKTSYEEALCLQVAGRDSIKRKKERRSYFPIVQNPMCGLIHTHTSFAFALSSIP